MIQPSTDNPCFTACIWFKCTWFSELSFSAFVDFAVISSAMKRASSTADSHSGPSYFIYGEELSRGPGGYAGLGSMCQGCGTCVRESRIHTHGLAKSSKKARLNVFEESKILTRAAKMGVYIYASPFNRSSKILEDLES